MITHAYRKLYRGIWLISHFWHSCLLIPKIPKGYYCYEYIKQGKNYIVKRMCPYLDYVAGCDLCLLTASDCKKEKIKTCER